MGRFLFFLLLVANLAFGAHLSALARARRAPDLWRHEKNAGEVKIVSVTPPVSGQQKADEARRQAVALAGATCVEFTGIAGTEVGKVREALATLRLGERLTERVTWRRSRATGSTSRPRRTARPRRPPPPSSSARA